MTRISAKLQLVLVGQKQAKDGERKETGLLALFLVNERVKLIIYANMKHLDDDHSRIHPFFVRRNTRLSCINIDKKKIENSFDFLRGREKTRVSSFHLRMPGKLV